MSMTGIVEKECTLFGVLIALEHRVGFLTRDAPGGVPLNSISRVRKMT